MKEVGRKYIPEILRSYCVDNGIQFKTKEENYITLAAEGMKLSEIAKTMRVGQSTIKRWRSENPHISKAIDEVRRQSIEAVTEQRRRFIDDMYETALKEVKKLLKDENPWVKMNVIRMVFDRQDKMTALVESQDENATVVVFEGMREPPKPHVSFIEGEMADE